MKMIWPTLIWQLKVFGILSEFVTNYTMWCLFMLFDNLPRQTINNCFLIVSDKKGRNKAQNKRYYEVCKAFRR